MAKLWWVPLALGLSALLGVSAAMAQEIELPFPMASGPFPSPALDVALNTNGGLAYVVHEDGTIGIYSVGVADAFIAIADPIGASGEGYKPLALALTPDGTRLFVANGAVGDSALGVVTVWNIEPASGLINRGGQFTLPAGSGGLTGLAISADGGSLIVIGSPDDGASVLAIPRIPRYVTLTVMPFKQPCMGVGPMLCLQVIDSAGVRMFFYDSIDGFTFRWGNPVTLSVRVDQVENPPADASSLRYTLADVVLDEGYQPGMTFEARVPTALITPVSDGVYSLGGEIDFACATAGQCAGLAALLETSTEDIPITFIFPAVEGDPLIADITVLQE